SNARISFSQWNISSSCSEVSLNLVRLMGGIREESLRQGHRGSQRTRTNARVPPPVRCDVFLGVLCCPLRPSLGRRLPSVPLSQTKVRDALRKFPLSNRVESPPSQLSITRA